MISVAVPKQEGHPGKKRCLVRVLTDKTGTLREQRERKKGRKQEY